MIPTFEDYIKEGLWAKGFKRSETGKERLENTTWYPNGSKYIKLFLKNNNAKNYEDACRYEHIWNTFMKDGAYEEIDFETVAIIIGKIMDMYPEKDLTGFIFNTGLYQGYKFNHYDKELVFIGGDDNDQQVYWRNINYNNKGYNKEDYDDIEYIFQPEHGKFNIESRIESIDYIVNTSKKFLNL